MEVMAHIRVAKHPRGRKGYQVDATTKRNHHPLYDSQGRVLPTVNFAVKLDIPDKAFTEAANVVAELRIPEEKLEIAAEVLGLEDE